MSAELGSPGRVDNHISSSSVSPRSTQSLLDESSNSSPYNQLSSDTSAEAETSSPLSDKTPWLSQSGSIGLPAVNTFNPFHSLPYMNGPVFPSPNEDYQPINAQYQDWQLEASTGYFSNIYGGTSHSSGNQRHRIPFNYNTSYNPALYNLHNTSIANGLASGPSWRNNSGIGEAFYNPMTTFTQNRARSFSSPQGPRRWKASGLAVKAGPDSPSPYQQQFLPQLYPGNALAQVAHQAKLQANSRHGQAQTSQGVSSVVSAQLTLEKTSEIVSKITTGKSIPTPVPSLFAGPSPEEALEQSLYNPNQTTNVYIRGLPPDITDEKLVEICERFGEITSSKAILDMQTNTCKGFGFACFKNEADATACIAGLIYCGYQVSFAKESFSTRLKNLQDLQSTNLYLSNLPLTMHEKDLEELFQPYKVVSNRILRDSNNASRGVGFARLADRESAAAIIEKFDNCVIGQGDNAMPLQVRFADSPSQKRLKGQTQRRRQWRAREYNLLTGHLTYADIAGESYVQNSPGLFMFNASTGLPVSPINLREGFHQGIDPSNQFPSTRQENQPIKLEQTNIDNKTTADVVAKDLSEKLVVA